jgi:xanthine dehydrogenase YagS FAD-binding subunit
VLGGVAPKPWSAPKAAEALVGAVAGAEPLAHNAYKVPLVKGLILKAMEALAKR